MGECNISPVPFNAPVGSMGFGAMEGLDPYIKTVGATHSTSRSVPWGFGSMKGIDPYIETVGATHSTKPYGF